MTVDPYAPGGEFPYNPMADDIDSLGELMQSVLDSIAGVFAQANVGLPDRQYITFGETAHDCEQLTISLEQMYLGPPGQPSELPQHCNVPRTAVFVVQLVRCVPTISSSGGRASQASAPTPESITATARNQARDAWLLLAAGSSAVDQWGIGVIADIAAGPASGGYQALIMNLIVAVP